MSAAKAKAQASTGAVKAAARTCYAAEDAAERRSPVDHRHLMLRRRHGRDGRPKPRARRGSSTRRMAAERSRRHEAERRRDERERNEDSGPHHDRDGEHALHSDMI